MQHAKKNDMKDNSNNIDPMMGTGPTEIEVADCKTEPHIFQNFDDSRTKGVSSGKNSKEREEKKEKDDIEVSNNTRKYINNSFKGRNGDRKGKSTIKPRIATRSKITQTSRL